MKPLFSTIIFIDRYDFADDNITIIVCISGKNILLIVEEEGWSILNTRGIDQTKVMLRSQGVRLDIVYDILDASWRKISTEANLRAYIICSYSNTSGSYGKE